MDNLLAAYLSAAEETEADRHLEDLLQNRAGPVVRKIVYARLGSQLGDAEDVCAEVVAELFVRLQDLKTDAGSNPIDSFDHYVAVVARNGCSRHIRQKYPKRWGLQTKLRHLLVQDREFALWETAERVWACGLALWRGKQALTLGADLTSRILEGRQRNVHPVTSLHAIFRVAGGPLSLDTLIELTADLWGVKDATEVDNQGELMNLLTDPRPLADVEIDRRREVQRLWIEISELPPRQRAALLLNLKDGQGQSVVALFPLTGAASIRQIASVLGMPPLEFAELWNLLPLDDNAIAARLACSRQQVINLRMSARKRLTNRIAVEAISLPLSPLER